MAVNILLVVRSSPCLVLRISFDKTVLGSVCGSTEEKNGWRVVKRRIKQRPKAHNLYLSSIEI
jgi:hypothetical protein